ncbi:MAG TPA: antitoxin MazE family protein [Acetobacteraceae bacterium]|jgi:hypothetical protein|nr:antitoxin MazE family protein [Acetobacteraceae bacterium]
MSKTNTAGRVQQSRERMRARGMRLVQFWVPDTRAPGFADELARQCRVLAEHPDGELDTWLDQLNEETLADLDAAEARGE